MGQSTLVKIDNIIGRVNTHPDYSVSLSRRFFAQMQDEANYHSYSLELEADPSTRDSTPDMIKRTYLEYLSRGKSYLASRGISLESLDGLVRLIEPSARSKGVRRNEDVKFGPFDGVKGEKVVMETENLAWQLNNNSGIHPVDRATFAHSEMIRIHPYSDGNGRAARLLQNFCLEQRGYPPAIIPVTDREVYISILEAVFREKLNNEEHRTDLKISQKIFYDFIAAKVLDSAQRLETELRENRIYEVSFTGVKSLEPIRTIAHALKGAQSKRGRSVQANQFRKDGKNATMTVKGNIGKEDLNQFMNDFAERYKLKCAIRSVTNF